jgi:hypothetical protein
MKSAQLFHRRRQQIASDYARLTARIPPRQQPAWQALDLSYPQYQGTRAEFLLDATGCGHLSIFGPQGALVAVVRVRRGDVGPGLPPEGPLNFIFWKDYRMIKLHAVVRYVAQSEKTPARGTARFRHPQSRG